jgi:hypothetical protein
VHEQYAPETEALFPESDSSRAQSKSPLANMDWRQLLGGLLVVAGLVIVIVGWYRASGTTSTTNQFSYVISAGFGGGAVVIIGAVFLIAYEHFLDRQAMVELQQRLARLEQGMAGEFDNLHDGIQTFLNVPGAVPADNGPARVSTGRVRRPRQG